MARYPQKRHLAKKPPNRSQILKRNSQYRQTYRELQLELMKEALKDKPAVVIVQVEGHYLEIGNIKGAKTLLIVPFYEAKKQLGSFIFYRANLSTLVNLYYVTEIMHNEEGYWLNLPNKWQVKLRPDDEKTMKILQQLLLDTYVMDEIRRLRRKRI